MKVAINRVYKSFYLSDVMTHKVLGKSIGRSVHRMRRDAIAVTGHCIGLCKKAWKMSRQFIGISDTENVMKHDRSVGHLLYN